MIPSLLSPPASPTDEPSGDMQTDAMDGFDGRNDVVKTALECVFIGLAVFSLVFCLLLRLICVSRAGRRPLRDFLKPLPETIRSENHTADDTYRAGRPYSVSAPPRSPGRAHTRTRRSQRARIDEAWLPAYDDKDIPPRYQDVVDHDPSSPLSPTSPPVSSGSEPPFPISPGPAAQPNFTGPTTEQPATEPRGS